MKERFFSVVPSEFRTYEGNVVLPQRQTMGSVGYDFCTPVNIYLDSGEETKLIFTDVNVKMNQDEALMLYVRSSMGIKHGIVLSNTVGVIDSDYYMNDSNGGNIGFKLKNIGDKPVFIAKGERVIQGVFTKVLFADESGQDFKDRNGGFGSTNI